MRMQLRHQNLAPNIPYLVHRRQSGCSHVCTADSAGTAHLTTLILQRRHCHRSRVARRRRCGPQLSDCWQDGAAAVEIDRCGGHLGGHGTGLDTLQVADDRGKVSHENFPGVDTRCGEALHFHESTELDGFILREGDG